MRSRRVWLACLLLAAPLASSCVDETSTIRLTSFAVDGVANVNEQDLRRTLATRAGGRWPWSQRVSFDEQAFRQDLERIRQFYTDRGFPDARIDAVETAFNADRTAVRVTVRIAEGEPLIVDTVSFVGFDVLDETVRGSLEGGRIAARARHDRAAILSTRQAGIDLLRDHGFAYGAVTIDEARSAPGRVAVTFRANPGPKTVFGPVTVVGLNSLDERVVRRQLSVRTGDTYNASRVVQSQRRLSALEVLQFVNVDARPPEGQPVEIPVRVTIAEDKLRRLQIGAGYGTEERLRGSIEWAHLNFLGDARRASLRAEWSSIQRGVQANFTEPYFLRRGLSLESRLSTQWVGERIYTAASYGGRTGLVYRFPSRARGSARAPGDRISATYIYEFLRHDVRPDVRLELTSAEELIALGFDPVTGHGRGTRAAIAADYQRVAVDNVASPRLGYSVSAHLETAGPMLGGTYDYREARAELKAYAPLGSSVVAARVSVGAFDAESDADVPFPQRYFLGGASSLRGWGRYQVAPLADGVPVGGLNVTEASLELRVPIRPAIGVVGFVDAGKVGSGGIATSTPLLSSAGIGLRYQTPIGLVRGDAALQLKPFEGLNDERTEQARSWRLHIGIGHSF